MEKTWSERYYDPQLPEPGGCQATILRLSKKEDGDSRNRILFANPARQDVRSTGTVKLSYDEGRTWPIAKVICPESYAYSCLTVLPDRTIACLYEANFLHRFYEDGQIVYGRFNLQWLTDGKDERNAISQKPVVFEGLARTHRSVSPEGVPALIAHLPHAWLAFRGIVNHRRKFKRIICFE